MVQLASSACVPGGWVELAPNSVGTTGFGCWRGRMGGVERG